MLYYISGGMLMRYIAHTSFSDRETEQQLCYFIDYNKSEKDDLSLLKDAKYLSSTVWAYLPECQIVDHPKYLQN
jgi:hypothetical protein